MTPASTSSIPTPIVTLISALLLFAAAHPPASSAQDNLQRIGFLSSGSMATNVDLSATGEYLAVGLRGAGDANGEVVLWNRSDNEPVWSRSLSTARAPKVAFDSSGTRLVVTTNGGEVTVWNLTEGTSIAPEQTGAPVGDVTFASGGAVGVGVDLQNGDDTQQKGAVRVWKGGMEETFTDWQTATPVRSLSFRPGSSEVVFTSGSGTITEWNYNVNTTRTVETASMCPGEIVELQAPAGTDRVYLTAQTERTCNPDYLCVIDLEQGAVARKLQRKNVDQIEPLGDHEIAYSRGRYVYRVDVQTGAEEIVLDSKHTVHDLAYVNGTLAVANSDIVLVDL